MTNLFDLTGRTAVVTGSAQGMGRAMALALAEAGADTVLLDRNAAGIEATAHSVRALGRKALPIAGDVTDTDHMDRVFATVDSAFGRVDILGNVAGEAKAGAAEDMALADIGAYGEQVFLRPDLGSQDLAEAVERFESLFEPGSIVPIAMASQYH